MMIAKKSFIKILLLLILAFSLNLATPKPVYAQQLTWDPAVFTINNVKFIWDKVGKAWDTTYKKVATRMIQNAASQFANKLAYDVANSIATGAEGGKPLFRTESIKKSLQNAQDAALGEFVGDLTSKSFSKLGFNLCDPSIEVKLTMTLYLIDSEAPPPPKCNWRDVQKQWAEFSDQVATGRWQDFIKIKLNPNYGTAKDWNDFWSQFDEGKNDLSVLSTLKDRAAEAKAKAAEAAKIGATECNGYLDKKTKITEEVKTHCQDILGLAQYQWQAAMEADANFNGPPENTSALKQILQQAGNMFTRTLSSRLLKFYVDKGIRQIASWYQKDSSFRDSLLAKLRGGADLRRAPRGSDVFRDLKTTTFETVEDFSLVENFIICPDQVDFRHPDNCAMSAELLNVLSQKKTIKQAISDGDLDGSLPFISAADTRNNSDTCYKEGFCYHNLVKLRKANIIPIGWELAAQASSGGQAPTLSQVADCFENNTCAFASNDGNNPYYHLVDPNWVLKVPVARCEAFVYASTLEANGSSNRQQYCADVKTCLQEDDEGNCLDDAFGYCTQSANVWRLNADICEDGDIYAGCLTFNNEELGNASYLEQSLEYCGADGAGCKRYSQEKDANNDWALQAIATDNNDLFLNKQASSCNEEDGGCSEFIVMAANRSTNILPNGDFDYEMQGWHSNAGVANIVNTDAYFGQNALSFSGSLSISADTGYVLKDRTFILSFYAKSINAGHSLTAIIADSQVTTTLIPDWQKIELKHTFVADDNTQIINLDFTANNEVMIDAVKLEEVSNTQSSAGNFSGYGDGTRIFMTDERQMCVAEEVGCQGYYPNNNDPMIPAVVNSGDLCPNECVGYENFAQAPTYFDLSEDTEAPTEYYNFIPSTAQSCPSIAVGCEEFTNEEAVAAGGEGKEYFTYLRQCVASNASNVATFYTWEGEDVAGYQLKTWTFLKNSQGAPCTNITPGSEECTDDGLNDAMCGLDTPANPFDDPEYNPNCREFFDTDSNAYFRLQDKVVYASDECKTYRRASSGEEYQAIAALSYSCPAQYNGCRAYTGNAANNVRRLFLDNFESGSYNPWSGSGLDLSNQALANNGHSLKISANTMISRPLANLRDKQAYQLTWWMKNTGSLSNVQAALYDGIAEVSHPIESLGVVAAGDWRRYQLSVQAPIDFANMDNISLQINFVGVGEVFLDNILLSEVADNLSFVKNSWTTPAACDDPFTGAYLGCQAYADTNGSEYTFKSFANLCREEAIGCLAAIDTKNSKSPFSETFHQDDNNSRISVAADSVTYLVPEQDKYCPQAYKGCSALGLPILDQAAGDISGYQTVYKINNPDNYTRSLCDNEDLYCEEYNSDKGTYYFKDPGNRTCSYQKNVNYNGITTTGWFKTDSLETASPVICSQAEINDWAQACPEEKNLCTEIKDPLDPITCDVAAPAGSTNACQSYYYYKNDKIDQSSCNGQFDQNSGCTLLYDANLWNAAHTQVNLSYNAATTYAENISAGQAVNPISNNLNNANMLVKVRKDRECSEWLDCKSASAVFNPQTNTYDTVCDAIGTCLEYDNTNSINHCKRWAPDTTADDIALTDEVYRARTTGANNHLAWSDPDYLGYSIPNLLPLDSLSTYNFSSDDTPKDQADIRLVYQADSNVCNGKPDGDDCSDQINGVDFDCECKDSICWLNPYTVQNAVPMSLALDTRAYSAPDAPFVASIRADKTNTVQNYSGANLCENGDNTCETSYDKVTFGTGGLVKYLGEDINQYPAICIYLGANDVPVGVVQGSKCDPAIATSCGTGGSCASPKGVCGMVDEAAEARGMTEGSFCSIHDDCAESLSSTGRCLLPTKIETYLNWPGICLEEDPSTSVPIDGNGGIERKNYCNQWYPVDEVAGAQSLYNNFKEAGFYSDSGNDLQMCVIPAEYVTTADQYYCVATNVNASGVQDYTYCSALAKVPTGTRVNLNKAVQFSNLAPLREGAYFYHDDAFVVGTLSASIILRNRTNNDGQELTCSEGDEPRNDCFDLNDLFQVNDFDWPDSPAPSNLQGIVSYGVFKDIFTDNVTYIYFDEAVRGSGTWDFMYGYQENATNFGKLAIDLNNDGSEEDKVLAPGSVVGMCNNCQVLPECPIGSHRVETVHYYNSNDHRMARWCNPNFENQNRNYYVEMSTSLTAWNIDCAQTNCGHGIDSYYRPYSDGPDCSGMSCLQQCQVISEVSGEGEHEESSWVRTDIWWRYSQNDYTNGFLAPWYYDLATVSYMSNTFANIENVNLYFGSAENSVTSTPVITKTPPNQDRYANEAGIFFDDDSIVEARDQMKFLFGYLYNLTWTSDGYDDQSEEDLRGFNDINKRAGIDYNPYIFQVCANNLCDANAQGITINNQNTGDMYGHGSLFTAVQFYYLAHPDHMPLISLSVDWEDGSPVDPAEGKMKNNLPAEYCDPLKDIPIGTGKMSFGGTARACHSGYKTFYHTYTYKADAIYACNGNNKPNITNAACYQPTVTVTDNWEQATTETYAGWVVVYNN